MCLPTWLNQVLCKIRKRIHQTSMDNSIKMAFESLGFTGGSTLFRLRLMNGALLQLVHFTKSLNGTDTNKESKKSWLDIILIDMVKIVILIPSNRYGLIVVSIIFTMP